MVRAYMKLDTLAFERKAVEDHYTPAQFGAFIAVLNLGEHQPRRGRFRSEHSLRSQLDDPDRGVKGYARHVPFLMEQGDLIRQDDGSLYMDGWDEWQEGDYTVTERMARMRNRKRNGDRNPDRNAPRHSPSDVTPQDGTTNGELDADATVARDDQVRLQKLAESLTGTPYVLANLHGGWGAKALDQLQRHGWAETERAWRAAAKATGSESPTVRQLVLGADDRLDPVPQVGRETPADEKARGVAMLRDLAAQKRAERESSRAS